MYNCSDISHNKNQLTTIGKNAILCMDITRTQTLKQNVDELFANSAF